MRGHISFLPTLPALAARLALALSLAGLAVTAGAADPPADTERGHDLARRWCAGCHDVERREAQQRADGVPSFLALANDPRNTTERLRAFLVRPHGRMPDLNLSRQEREDVIAWLASLREGRATPDLREPARPRP